MHHHIIVSGDDALATTIVEELKRAGARVVKLANPELANVGVARELARAEVARAVTPHAGRVHRQEKNCGQCRRHEQGRPDLDRLPIIGA